MSTRTSRPIGPDDGWPRSLFQLCIRTTHRRPGSSDPCGNFGAPQVRFDRAQLRSPDISEDRRVLLLRHDDELMLRNVDIVIRNDPAQEAQARADVIRLIAALTAESRVSYTTSC